MGRGFPILLAYSRAIAVIVNAPPFENECTRIFESLGRVYKISSAGCKRATLVEKDVRVWRVEVVTTRMREEG